MSIQVAWDNENKTVIRFDFDGKWNWYGYEMAVGESFGLFESVTHPVDFIFNMQRSATLPDGATFYLKRTLELAPGQPKLVIAHADHWAKANVSLFCKIYKKLSGRLLTAHTLGDARKLLTEPVVAAPAPRRTGIRLIAAS
jgi:hypothetical protein